MEEFEEGRIRTARVLARRIAILRRGEDFYAFEADCKHMKQSLGGGIVEGNILTCPAHGWKYDITTGQCLNESWARLKTFEVIVEDDIVYVEV